MGARSFLFLLASTRAGGNTEALARAAAAGLPSGVEQRWLRLTEQVLPPFVDIRHDGDGVYPAPEGPARVLLDATLAATDVVVATPMYWYSISTPAKHYLDHWSAWMRVPGVDFKARMRGTTLWGVTAHTSELEMTEPLVGTLRLTAEYMGMRWGGVLLGNANRPGELAADTAALARAATFFEAAGTQVIEPEPGTERVA